MDLIGGEANVSMDSDDIDTLSMGLGAPDQEALEKAALEAQKEKEAAEEFARKAAQALKRAEQEEAKRLEMEQWKKETAKKAAEKAAIEAVLKQEKALEVQKEKQRLEKLYLDMWERKEEENR